MICIQNNEMKYDYKIDTLHLKRRETLSNVEKSFRNKEILLKKL
jgi:hypothetical protein